MAIPQPSKLMRGVRFSYPAPDIMIHGKLDIKVIKWPKLGNLNMPEYETINELESEVKMNDTLKTQAAAASAIRTRGYIVGSISTDGAFSVSANPRPHTHESDARAECARLAKASPGRMYVMLKLAGAEMVPVSTLSI